MEAFLKENWIWIVAPIVVVIAAVVVILVVSEGDPASSFIYNIH